MAGYDWHAHLGRSTVYSDSRADNQALIRRVVTYVFQRYALNPEPSAPHRWGPQGITLAFPDCRFVTIEMRKEDYGLKLRLSGSLKRLQSLGAPDQPKAKDGVDRDGKSKGFVRVYIDDPADVGPALEWIDASARYRKLSSRK